jgi:arginyl-tRNA--protein-N-Asp/Glu arginylyltransferase
MYLSWNEKKLDDFSDNSVEAVYNDGYVFTRIGKGAMNQTRSLRINLNKFELSSENRRVLNKTDGLNLSAQAIPYVKYEWTIHKIGKEFYEKKFGKKIFSAQKIKELITNEAKSNFNKLFIYNKDQKNIGYCIALETKNILHYCYPFYRLQTTYYGLQNIGIGMMLKAVIWAKENKKKYVYLGSMQRPGDIYKLQFAGLEWFDGNVWQGNLKKLKNTV